MVVVLLKLLKVPDDMHLTCVKSCLTSADILILILQWLCLPCRFPQSWTGKVPR